MQLEHSLCAQDLLSHVGPTQVLIEFGSVTHKSVIVRHLL